MAMFINHSCNPNCETEEIRGRVRNKAIRKIQPGEEITYDYCLYDGGEDEATCDCGAKRRGTMYSREEIRRRKAAVGVREEESRGKTFPQQGCPGSPPARGCRRGRRRLKPLLANAIH